MWALWGLAPSLSVAGALLWQTQLFAALTCLATCWTLPCLGSASKRPKPITSPSGLYNAAQAGRPSLHFPHFPWCLGPRPSEGGRSPQQSPQRDVAPALGTPTQGGRAWSSKGWENGGYRGHAPSAPGSPGLLGGQRGSFKARCG